MTPPTILAPRCSASPCATPSTPTAPPTARSGPSSRTSASRSSASRGSATRSLAVRLLAGGVRAPPSCSSGRSRGRSPSRSARRRRRRRHDPRGRGHDARGRRVRLVHRGRSRSLVGRRDRGRGLPRRGRLAALRRAHHPRDPAADRLPRRRRRREASLHAKLQGRYGGNLDCREIRAGATVVLPVEHEGAGLYFGDCKALMGDGEIVDPPEVGALVTASAQCRARGRVDDVAAASRPPTR